MLVKEFEDGLLGSNTFLVWDQVSKEGMVVDCGNPPEQIKSFAIENGIKVVWIVLTHGHCDHAKYADEYKTAFPEATLAAHAAENAVLTDPEANVTVYFGGAEAYKPAEESLNDGDTLRLGEGELTVISTPGHTPGSICLYSSEDGIMFTGDTLFANGYGRTDFKYGSFQELRESLKRLWRMGGTVCYPGHGEAFRISGS